MEINALTKLGALLEAHPELEESLIAHVPAFAKLRNPILRATVAKVATLEQAAKVGNVPLPELIGFLRAKLGHDAAPSPTPAATPTAETFPPWFRPEAVVAELDAAELLAGGGHPVNVVKKALGAHPPGALIVLKSDFEPAPLLAQFRGEGVLTACVKEGTRFKTCLRRP